MKFAQLALRVIAVLSFIVAIIWMIVAPGFEPLTVALSGVAFLITSFVIDKPKEETESLDQHNRRVMLNHVENFWVKGILEKSLHGAALLELGIKEDPTAINYPWAIKRESTDETLPAGKSMLEIFNEIGMERSLLILGAPGSGKTTMLLELARQLIERARNDKTEPIPVVFNLASWAEKQTLSEWLAEQLNIIYSVPKKTAPKWVAENKMLLLLDGLDEVKEESREKCVDAINQFKKEHGLTSLVVCSRVEEYKEINTKLSFEGAISLQSLTPQQVDAYFDRFGNRLANIRQLLESDDAMRELAETPLMLSIMTLAYKDRKPEELPASNDEEVQRKHLFDTYINRMFERPTRISKSSFTKHQTLRYLSWLARKMIQHNLITYQIEAMQPFWLEGEKQGRLYRWLGGLNNEISMVDKFKWSWKKFKKDLRLGLTIGLGFGMMIMLIFGLAAWLRDGLNVWLIGDATIIGLFVGLLFALLFGLSFGLSGGLIPEQIEETTRPGQRLKQSLYSGILGGLSLGLLIGLMLGVGLGLFVGLIFGHNTGLFIGLIVVVFFSLLNSIVSGIGVLIQHFALRFILTKNGFLPRQLYSFLDYAVDLIFLRRVGGSYIFVHRLLMEHFAEMTED